MALNSIEGDKALGSDGFNFNFRFIKACRDTVGPDFLEDFRELYDSGVINKGLKNSLITFIPEREGPSKLSHYRPISLIGCA